MIEVRFHENIEETLSDPEKHITSDSDIYLLRIYSPQTKNNPICIMVGKNEDDNRFYIVVEDNDGSTDVYPENGETLLSLYTRILSEIIAKYDE